MNAKKILALLLSLCMILGLAACGTNNPPADTTAATEASENVEETAEETVEETVDPNWAAAEHVAELIDAIYVQQRTEDTDAQCAEAKAAWDALTDEHM